MLKYVVDSDNLIASIKEQIEFREAIYTGEELKIRTEELNNVISMIEQLSEGKPIYSQDAVYINLSEEDAEKIKEILSREGMSNDK